MSRPIQVKPADSESRTGKRVDSFSLIKSIVEYYFREKLPYYHTRISSSI